MEIAVSGSQMIFALVVSIFVLIFMIMKTKIHAFLALIIAAALTGVLGGMPTAGILKSISDGFGGTLASIGIIIGFGVMMGELFEYSGAAETMAKTFLKRLGKGREELALAITGFIVSIPIFCDSGFVILSPIAKAISKKTNKSVISLGVSLAVGLVITHSLVPPTPGPVGVAGLFGISVGSLILWGIVVAIPMMLTGMAYAKYIGSKIYQIPSEDGEGWVRLSGPQKITSYTGEDDGKKLPSAFASFAPIVVPIILIILQTVGAVLKIQGPVANIINFFGAPVIAVGIGLIIAIYGLTGNVSRSETIDQMEKGIRSAGIIILVTGGGGALGRVLRDSGAGDYLAQLIAQTALPAILLPFIIASLLRLMQGSGTVAMITSASITAPMLATLNVNPIFAALAACTGSLLYSYFNDSYFWVVTRTLGIREAKEQMKIWSVTTTIAWATGLVTILILNAIFG
jgi:GntP family gluconate:H+ symporter